MRNENNNPTFPPRILIEGGGKKYYVLLENLSEFLNSCENKLNLYTVDDMEAQINSTMDLVIEAFDDENDAGELKLHLQFLRELNFLFKGMLYEQPA